jgi:hypothetical protein
MKDELIRIIGRDYQNLLDMDIIVRKKSKEIETDKQGLLSKDIQDLEKVSKLYSNMYVDLVLFGKDLKVLFDRVHFLINLFRELGYSGLPEEIVKFYNESIENSPRQIFYMKDGDLMEKEEGMLEKERNKFLESDFMKNFKTVE